MNLQQLGEAVGKGIISSLADYLVIVLVVCVLIRLACNAFSFGTDDSDKSGWERSGMSIHIDHRTGVQYVSDGKGGMCVRTDANGKPVIDRRGDL